MGNAGIRLVAVGTLAESAVPANATAAESLKKELERVTRSLAGKEDGEGSEKFASNLSVGSKRRLHEGVGVGVY